MKLQRIFFTIHLMLFAVVISCEQYDDELGDGGSGEIDERSPTIPDQLPDPDQTPPDTTKPVKVYILSGQSNMVGMGEVGSLGTPGTLETLTKTDKKFTHLVDDEGNWTVRNDVWYKGVVTAKANKWLTVGCGSRSSTIGPELGFGHVMGYVHKEPVIIIKASQGNRSLAWDILPPGSKRYTVDGVTYAGYGDKDPSWSDDDPYTEVDWYAGKQYDDFVNAIHDVLDNFDANFPEYKNQGYEIAGFAWFQGHKDQGNAVHASRYEMNLVNLIKAFRAEFKVPKAPFVISTIGFNGWEMKDNALTVANAQLAVSGEKGNYPEFAGNVLTVESRDFWRDKSISPKEQGYHYNRNAETYMLVGEALGRGMAKLLGGSTDNCPDDPDKTEPGQCGCGVPEGSCSGDTTLYEAENRTDENGCSEKSNHKGFTGSGFMDYGRKDTWIEWNNVRAEKAGDYLLTFRYANGGTPTRESAAIINGQDTGNLDFANTGGWTKWRTETITVSLDAGNNTIRIMANTDDGGPNLDSMEVKNANGGDGGTSICVEVKERKTASLSCENGQTIGSINFASYGLPTGSCSGGFTTSTCHASTSLDEVKAACLSKTSCSVFANNSVFGDPCKGKEKKLAVIYTCQGDTQDDDSVAYEELLKRYSTTLINLMKEIREQIPSINATKKTKFEQAHEVCMAKEPYSDDNPEFDNAQKKALALATPILQDLDSFLSSDKLDNQLVKLAVLANATPHYLAEFGSENPRNHKLIEQLLADTDLMKRMLVAGGPNENKYGKAMQVYTDILASSEKANLGILNRLALGTGLEFAVPIDLAGDNQPNPVKRYKHYEKAFLDGELDPKFPDMRDWECRFITNEPYSDEEITWGREMMRNYRPDHMFREDYQWRYVYIVKSDVKYTTPEWDPENKTLKIQQLFAGGGKCGPRAWAGRWAARSFGIPVWGVKQKGHAAMSHWVPDNWVTCLGAHWRHNYWTYQTGLDFYLEAQARNYTTEFMKVLRAQWVGDVLGEQNVNPKKYGTEGGLWNALAFYKKLAIVAEGKPSAIILPPKVLPEETQSTWAEEVMNTPITDADYAITVDQKGVITLPAASTSKPTDSTGGVLFMKSFLGGMQLHYKKGSTEEFEYEIEVPRAGTYLLSAKVVTVHKDQNLLLTHNDSKTPTEITVPYTIGYWQETPSVQITLNHGLNTLKFASKEDHRGITIKEFTLQPK